MSGIYTSNSNMHSETRTQPPSRKRKCENEQNEMNEGASRKRQTTSRALLEGSRLPRDESRPEVSQNQPTAPNPFLPGKTSSELCSHAGSCTIPLIVNSSVTNTGSTLNDFSFHASHSGTTTRRQTHAVDQTLPIFSECQMLPVNPARQCSLCYFPSIITRHTQGGVPPSFLPTSLPVQFLQDRNCHSPCLICCPAGSSTRGFPVPPTEVPTVRRGDVMSHSASLVTRSFSANHSNPSAQHHHHYHRMQPPQPITDRGQHLRQAPFHQLGTSQFPDLRSLGQFPANSFPDFNNNGIPAPSRVPFREIDSFNMTLRESEGKNVGNQKTPLDFQEIRRKIHIHISPRVDDGNTKDLMRSATRSLSNRQHQPSSFTDAMSHFGSPWLQHLPSTEMENAFILMPQSVSPEFQILPSFDVQNYEALLGLAQQLADSKPKGLTKSELDQLPTFHYNPDLNQSTMTNCVICMSDFEAKQRLRALHCKHQFHSKCINKWLKTNRTCPMCRTDALKAKGSPKSKKLRNQ